MAQSTETEEIALDIFVKSKDETLRLIRDAKDLTSLFNDGLTKVLSAAQERLQKGRIYIVVCGEFKQGKSSLINAIVGRTRLLPTDIDVATSIVTMVSWAEKESATVYRHNNNREIASEASLEELSKFVTESENPNNLKGVRLVDVHVNSEYLASGIVLIDTPGIGGISIEHSDITYSFIPTADLVLFVTSAQAPLTTHELNFLTQRVIPFGRHIVFALNRIDRQREWPKILEDDRAKIARAFNINPSDAQIFPVSARNYLQSLKSGIKDDEIDSRLPDLKHAIDSYLASNNAQLLIARARDEILRVMADIRRPIATGLDAFRAKTEGELSELEGRVKSAQIRLEELRDQNAKWRRDILYGFQDIRREAAHEEQIRAARIRQEFEVRVASHSDLLDPPRIGRDTAADLQTYRGLLLQSILQQVERLRDKIAQDAKIRLSGVDSQEDSAHEIGPLPDLPSGPEARGLTRRTIAVGRSAAAHSSGGALVGSFAGSVIGVGLGLLAGGVGAIPGAQMGAALGAFLGGLVGAATGVREGLEGIRARDDAETRQSVTRILGPFVNENLTRIRHAQDDALVVFERNTVAEFEAALQRERNVNEEQLKVINQRRNLSKAEIISKSAAFESDLRAIDAVVARANAITSNSKVIDERTDKDKFGSNVSEENNAVRRKYGRVTDVSLD